MPNFNKVTLAGNVTRDPELRYTPQGTAVCEVSIAVNERWKDKVSGQQREEVNFFDCVLWAKTGEIAAQYLKKGKPVLFHGKLKQDRWEDQATGQKRSKIRITVDEMVFLGTGQAPGSSGDQTQEQAAPAGDPDADVPF